MKKVINNTTILKSIEDPDKVFSVVDSDQEFVMEDGVPVKKSTPAKAGDLIRIVLYNLPMQGLAMKDTLTAARFLEQLSKESIVVAKDDFDWLVERVEQVGPVIFGVNVVVLYRALASESEGGLVSDRMEGKEEETGEPGEG